VATVDRGRHAVGRGSAGGSQGAGRGASWRQSGTEGRNLLFARSRRVPVTSTFTDAVAVNERTFDGDLHTTLRDASANEIGRLKFDRIDGAHDIVQYSPRFGTPLQVFNEPGVRPTLHGNARQAYSMWKDRVDSDQSLEWQAGLMRKTGGVRRDLERETAEVQTEWSNGLSAKTVRRSVRPSDLIPGRALGGQVLVTRLMREGVAGVINWFPDRRVLVWNLPGLTKGFIASEHLKDYGNWPFTPDMEWLNIQIAAFHQFKTQIDRNGFVARSEPGWSGRVMQFFSPTLSANEPGCDGLHWLDGTVFRFCCDVHDLCYAKLGCSYRSWWRILDSWRCDFCNAWVVECFFDGGVNWDDRRINR
jgi:hypothetical protein